MLETSTDSNTDKECQQMYLSIYNNLCQSKKQLKESWVQGSGLHRHHIIPVHSGGTDEETNFTYLTVREHVIAHYLLWKIYKNPNDLRSMKMLGAHLTSAQRQVIGKFCFDNNVGIFSEEFKNDKSAQIEKSKKAALTQKINKLGTFSDDGRKALASAGGKISGAKQKLNNVGIHNPKNFKKNASFGGKAIKGMICVTNGFHRTRIQPRNLQKYLSSGYRKGFTLNACDNES